MVSGIKKEPAKKGYRRKKSIRASRLTMEILSPAMRRQGFTQNEIISKWPHIVGDNIAETVVPLKINFPRGMRSQGTLVVRCEGAFAPKLQQRIPMIIESVNSYYGYLAVTNIQIQQGPLPKKRIHRKAEKLLPSQHVIREVGSMVDKTKSEDLRQALQNLGEQMLAKDEKKKKK